jgi:protein TonB
MAAKLAAERSDTMASEKPSPGTPAKPSALPADKLGVTPPVRTGEVPVKTAIASAKPSAIALAPVKAAVLSGNSNAITATQPAEPPVTPTPKPAGNTLKIAPGTAEGMLIKKVPPTYPLEAKVARVQGTVLLNVTISKTGAVTAVEVVSGPELLQSAAVDAVKQWEFRPFSLVGEPVEFETSVHVVFGTGGAPARVQAQGHQ